MNSKPYSVLTNYSEETNPNFLKSNAWKDTVKDIDSQRNLSKTPGFSLVAELLSKFQSEIFDILKLAKRTDEISIKAKLWEVFNALSNSLWTNFFKGKPEEKDFSYENKMLKNSFLKLIGYL